MLSFNKIIFVSTENTCLSPLAEAIMKKELNKTSIDVTSRGLVVLFPEPPNPKAIEVAKNKGIDFSNHISSRLLGEDFGSDVLILVMSKQNKQRIYEEYKEAVNVYTIREFVGELGDVKPPYGCGLEEYAENHENIHRLVKKIIEKLIGEKQE